MSLVAGLHVGQVQVREDVRHEREQPVADRVPEVEDAVPVRRCRESASRTRRRPSPVEDGPEQDRVLLRVVLEVGVLDDDEVARRGAHAGARPPRPSPGCAAAAGRGRRPVPSSSLRMSRVPSVEPSSTMTISRSRPPRSTACTRATISRIVRRSLYAGITIDSFMALSLSSRRGRWSIPRDPPAFRARKSRAEAAGSPSRRPDHRGRPSPRVRST